MTERRRIHRVVAELGAANAAVAAMLLVTAPLQARALGPDGRGALAAIVVPLTVAPVVVGIGLDQYAAREAARGRDLGALVGSLVPLTLALGLLSALAGPLVAELVAGDRQTVETYLTIGFLVLPLVLVANVLLGVHIGLERWRRVVAARLLPPAAMLIAVVALYALDELTVATASIAVIASGALVAVPLIPLARGLRPRVERPVMRAAMAFGPAASASALGAALNFKLDQLLMTRLVSERELGLYAVAVTIASAALLVTHELGPAIFPRIASGDRDLAARAVRVTMPIVSVLCLAIAVVTVPTLSIFFGEAFADAAPMVWLLLVAAIPLAAISVLDRALIAAGAPTAVLRAQLISLALAVPALILLLPDLGGVGAAAISVAAYSANFAVLLRRTRRAFGGGLADYLVPRRSDLVWARETLRRMRRRPGMVGSEQ